MQYPYLDKVLSYRSGNSRTIFKKNKGLAGLRQEQSVHDRALESARADRTKARMTVMQKEKKIKKAEKTLDGKVLFALNQASLLLYDAEAQLVHSTRKLDNAFKSKEALSKAETQLQVKVTSLQQELASVTKAAQRAQGVICLPCHFYAQFIPYRYSRGAPTDFGA